ncbi:MAG: choice-of-anchor Q domain-containing protein, partial [Pseudomonadota bacterium]
GNPVVGISVEDSNITLQNTIVSGNAVPSGPEIDICGSSTINVDSHNLFGHSGAAGIGGFTPGASDIVPDAALTDILDTTLQNNGGPTETHALVAGSPAIDAVPLANCTLSTDQRGVARPQGAACDIGAFELEQDAAGGTLYVSSSSGGTVNGIGFRDEDILAFDLVGGAWSMFFDGSDVGLRRTDVDGFVVEDGGNILMTFSTPVTLPGVGSVGDSDIVRFTPTSTGDLTTGSFSLFFDGSDVGLTRKGEDIDAIAFDPDGRLVVSTTGRFNAGGAFGRDEDLSVFNATSFGPNTAGTFELYVDASDVGLTGRDVNGADVKGANGDIYLTKTGKFTLPGVSGDAADIFIFRPTLLGSTTTGTFHPFFDGSANGFGRENVDGFDIE